MKDELLAVPYVSTGHTFPIPSFSEFVAERAGTALIRASDATPSYAHPMDERVMRALRSVPFRMAMNALLNQMTVLSYGQCLSRGVQASARSFPELHQALLKCARTLGIPIPRMVVQHGTLYETLTSGTDDHCFIQVSSLFAALTNAQEITFVIGHECGHIHNRHVSYHTLAQLLGLVGVTAATTLTPGVGPLLRVFLPALEMPLLAWLRRSEITADRAGLICCGNLSAAESALMRMVLGFASSSEVDVEDYLNRAKQLKERGDQARYAEFLAGHPLLHKRILAMRLFAKSRLYHSLSDAPQDPSSLLDRCELDRQTEELLSVF